MTNLEAAQSINETIKSYTSQIDGLEETLMLMMIVNYAMHKKSHKQLVQFEEKNCTVRDDNGMRHVSIPVEHYTQWKKLKQSHSLSMNGMKLIPRSIFVALHSQFDAFLGKLLHIIFNAKLELLNPSKREFTFADLVEFDSINAIREHIIDKEIESLLRKSRSDQFKWMEERFSIPLKKFDSWPQFIESSQRRNLFVHSDGVISDQYIQECKNEGCIIEPNITVGENIKIPKDYFVSSAQCLREVGVKLAHILLRRFIPDQIELSDSSLNEYCYDLIERKDYKLAINLLDFGINCPKHSNDASKLTFIVNLAQAYKWSGNNSETIKILKSRDWSALDDNYQLAEAVLRENWDKAIFAMKRIGNSGKIKKIDYRDWPLFREFRKRDDFLQAYKEIFAESYPNIIIKEEDTFKSEEIKEDIDGTASSEEIAIE